MAEEKEKKTESHGKFSFVSSLNHVLETRFGNALNNLFSFYQSLFFFQQRWDGSKKYNILELRKGGMEKGKEAMDEKEIRRWKNADDDREKETRGNGMRKTKRDEL